jgi:hypothetical protein
MTRTLLSRLFALGAPAALATVSMVGCAEPSGTAGTIDAAPTAAAETPKEDAPTEPATEPDPVLAAADPSAASPGPDTAGEAAIAEPEDAPPPEPAIPAVPKRVLIVGSSLAATGFGAVLEEKLDAHPHIEAFRKAKSASGLVRPDYFDWFDQSKRQVEFRKPDLVIVFMGANDGQDMPAWRGSSRVAWGSDTWPGAYRGRVDEFLGNLSTTVEGQDHGADVMWLGLPKMTSASLERKVSIIRTVHQEAVAALGDRGLYIDTTPYLVDENGDLLETSKVRGKEQVLRSEDGVHFTMSGCEFLADKIYPQVLTALSLPSDEPSPSP